MATGANNNAVTLSSASSFLKEWYLGGGGLDRLMYESDPFLGRLKRRPATAMVGGKQIILPIRGSRTPSTSKTFSDAQSQSKERTGERKNWILKVDKEFGVIRVEDEAIYASKSDKGAFRQLLRDEADSVLMAVNQKRCTALFAGQPGVAGTVSAKTGANGITLSFAHQVTAFDIGDSCEFRSPSARTVNRPGFPFIVTKVNRATRVITFDKNVPAVANDEVYKTGDYGVTAMTGLNKWIPKTSAGIGTLNNIDRSEDPLRYGGHRIQMVAGDRYDDTIRKLCSQVNALTGSNPTMAVTSPLVENLIAIEQRAQIRFDNESGTGAGMTVGAGIGGLSIKTARGNVDIVTSAFAPTDTIWVLDETDLALYYLSDMGGDFVFFRKNPDGGMFKISHDSAGIEARVESFGEFAMQAPGRHGRIDLLSSAVPTFS